MSNPTPKQRLDVLEAMTKTPAAPHLGQYMMEVARILVDATEEQNALLRQAVALIGKEQREQVRHLLSDLSDGAQGVRIQQSQLLRDSRWDKERYGKAADEHWAQFNRAHKELWALLLGGETS